MAVERRTSRGAALIALSVLMQVGSAYFSKMAALTMSWSSPGAVLWNGYYLASLFCLGIQALAWPFVLRDFPLLVAYTVSTLVYPGILIVSVVFFGEKVGLLNAIGAAIIMIGVAIFAWGSRNGGK
jgi:drug/metabolite transporter (DMT)-like permease